MQEREETAQLSTYDNESFLKPAYYFCSDDSTASSTFQQLCAHSTPLSFPDSLVIAPALLVCSRTHVRVAGTQAPLPAPR